MAKRNRAKPQSHIQKWHQLKSQFKIHLPQPNSPSAKANITRYHRIIFGGRTRKGKHTIGIASYGKSYFGPHMDKLKGFFDRQKGIPKFTGSIIPKGFKIGKVTKQYVELRSKHVTRKVYFDPATAPSTGNYRISVGKNLMKGTYHNREIALREINRLFENYQKRGLEFYKDIIHLEEDEFENQE